VTRPTVRVPVKPAVERHPRRQPKKRRPKPKAAVKSTPPKHATVPRVDAFLPPAVVRHDEVESSSPAVVELGLGFTLALSVLLFGLAVRPLRASPRPAGAAGHDRRVPLLYIAVVVYIATGLSIAIALLMS
jgi:hypothetical protein